MKTQFLLKVTFVITLFLYFQIGHAQKPSDVTLPATYDFDYIYKLKMTHKKGDMVLDYYLKKDGDYFGFDSPEMAKANANAKMFMVMDANLNVTAMFMEMMGKKMVQKTKMNNMYSNTGDYDGSDYNFKEIESKTIMGYDCDGYVTENDKIKMTFYMTDDVPVSFNKVFGANMKNLPKGFDPELMKKYAENGLMMEMIFEDKKKSKNNVNMQCTGLDKTDFSINTSEYGSMMGAFGG